MAAVASQFPGLDLTLDDVISTYAGVRPVIGRGHGDPSKESRDHVVWEESGLLTVTGGKLTTFRRIALDALKAANKHLPHMPELNGKMPVLSPANLSLGRADVTEAERRRLLGRYGAKAPALVASAKRGELERIPGVASTWAELRWGAAAESVVHLEDLLLRRTRLGLLLPRGGEEILDRVGMICREELGWDGRTWQKEAEAYCRLWRDRYSLPERSRIQDWTRLLDEAKVARSTRTNVRRQRRRRRWIRGGIASGAVASASVLLGLGRWVWRRRSRVVRSVN
jgi:glycerol-3-phosphate dehydrogenase